MMPLFERFGSWFVDGFMLTLFMVITAFNYAMQNPIVQEDRLLEFAADSGRLIVHCLHNEFHFSLRTRAPEFYMTFNIDFCLEQRESDSGPAPEQQDPPSYFLQSDQCLVIPGVLFELPCPLCSHPLEWGQVCDHNNWGQLVIWWYRPDLSVEDLEANPFSIHEIIWAGSPILILLITTCLSWCSRFLAISSFTIGKCSTIAHQWIWQLWS